MKTKKQIISMLIFALIMVVALAGGNWDISYAVGSVPPEPPTSPITPPVTGCELCNPGAAATSPVVINNQEVTVSLKEKNNILKLEVTAPSGSLENGNSIAITVIDPTTDARVAGKVNNLSEVVTIGVSGKPDYQLKSNWKHVWMLCEIDAFIKDPSMGVLWYDEAKKTWVKLDAVVQGNKITVETKKTGVFAIGKIK